MAGGRRMNGKLVGGFIVAVALVAGAALYYLQVYAYYEEVAAEDVEIRLTSLMSSRPEPILAEDIRAIDADSSPLRFRACFRTPASLAALTEGYVLYDAPEPLIAPDWFDCFDAAELGRALEAGEALAFLGTEEVADGVDRVVAVYRDGRAYAWHQLNETYRE